MILRELRPDDVGEVEEMLTSSGAFSEEEIRVALEMATSDEYALLCAEIEGRVRGYVCLGLAPLTLTTWYLYWICVHPAVQGTGVGRAVHAHGEQFIRQQGGERLVLETSGRADYANTRHFYRNVGYREAGRIEDFFKPGDDCVILCKVLK